jgi:hypothetical protein
MENRMNLKNAYKEWQENCPDSYMINGQKRPIKWIRKLKAYKNKKRIENKETHAMIGSHERADI